MAEEKKEEDNLMVGSNGPSISELMTGEVLDIPTEPDATDVDSMGFIAKMEYKANLKQQAQDKIKKEKDEQEAAKERALQQELDRQQAKAQGLPEPQQSPEILVHKKKKSIAERFAEKLEQDEAK